MMIGGKARHIASGSRANEVAILDWSSAVREAAFQVIKAAELGQVRAPIFHDVPIAVSIVFRMRAPKKPHAAPMTKPDVDKLARCTLDAMTGSIFDDDSRVVELALVKVYAEPGREGARIVVKAWEPMQQHAAMPREGTAA